MAVARRVNASRFGTRSLLLGANEELKKSPEMIEAQVQRIQDRSGNDSRRARQARDIASVYLRNIENSQKYQENLAEYNRAYSNFTDAQERMANSRSSRIPKYYKEARNEFDNATLYYPTRLHYGRSTYAPTTQARGSVRG